MNDEFVLILPSNSSMEFYPQNTTTRYTTYLPARIDLQGNWRVALLEIQVPLTFQHVDTSLSERIMELHDIPLINPGEPDSGSSNDGAKIKHSPVYFTPGKYDDIDTFLKEINSSKSIRDHVEFSRTNGGRVSVKRTCSREGSTCTDIDHAISMRGNLEKIMGFGQILNGGAIVVDESSPKIGETPAVLSNALPRMLLIYADILEPYPTGDVKTNLLRTVPLDLDHYSYGSYFVKSYSPPTYLKLLYNSFRTIEINIRDEYGNAIPFDSGTAMITLHFKKWE